MNPIAEQALARARMRKPATTPPEQVVALVENESAPAAPVVTGHFSRVMYLEGRRHAADIVRASRSMLSTAEGIASLVATLRRATTGRPESYAKGIAEIAELLEQKSVRLWRQS